MTNNNFQKIEEQIINTFVDNNKDIKAFIIEDDKIEGSIIKKILKSNINIRSSELYPNGLLALEKLIALKEADEKLPDFIILDYNMPQMNGIEFIKSLKYLEVINQIPIFMNSSSIELDEYQHCLNYENLKRSFLKPFTTQTLNAILEYGVGNLKKGV